MTNENSSITTQYKDYSDLEQKQEQNAGLGLQKKLFDKSAACFSSNSTEYCTPKQLFDQLDNEFHFVLDPATMPDNPMKTKHFYTSETDGLKNSWNLGGNVFINPPYHSRRIFDWVQKAIATTLTGDNTTVVMLLPARTGVRWFHTYVWDHNRPKDCVEVRFIKNRIRFEVNGQRLDPAPFESMIVIFRPKDVMSK
jgi:phage N-6-adenine-methyltransferase